MSLGGSQGNPATADLEGMAPIVLTVEARLKRTGIEKRMVLGNGLEAATADPSLLPLIARAHGIRERLFDNTTLSLKEITDRPAGGLVAGGAHTGPPPLMAAGTRPNIGPWELDARRPRTPIRGRRSFDWTSRAKEALLWGNGPEGCASGPPAPTG